MTQQSALGPVEIRIDDSRSFPDGKTRRVDATPHPRFPLYPDRSFPYVSRHDTTAPVDTKTPQFDAETIAALKQLAALAPTLIALVKRLEASKAPAKPQSTPPRTLDASTEQPEPPSLSDELGERIRNANRGKPTPPSDRPHPADPRAFLARNEEPAPPITPIELEPRTDAGGVQAWLRAGLDRARKGNR